MKSSYLVVFIAAFIALAMMATNPSLDDHRQAVVNFALKDLDDYDEDDVWSQAGATLGKAIGASLIERFVDRENYLLFSLTHVTMGSKSRIIGIGVFGNVWLFKSREDLNLYDLFIE